MVDGSANINALMEQLSQKKPDLVEFRFDAVSDLEILKIIAETKKEFKMIAADKGKRDSASRKKLLKFAAESGFDLIDVDLDDRDSHEIIHLLKDSDAQLIISYHDLSGTPSHDHLSKILDKQRSNGGDVCKIVTTANHPRDNLTALSFVERNAPTARLVCFAMGRIGIPSRVLSPLYGAEFTFASLTEHSQTAEGQLSIDNLRKVWQILGVS